MSVEIGIPESWDYNTVEELRSPQARSLAAGPFGSSISSKFFVAEGVPVIRGSNLSCGKERFIADAFVFITPSKADGFRGAQVKAGDLVFTCWGTLGQVGIIPNDGPYPVYVISNKQLKFRPDPKKASSLFLYYYFASPSLRQRFKDVAIGAAVPGINLGILRREKIPLPKLSEQQKIAAILTAYDDLIENNRQRIALLEKMAEEIYREWFVRLRFPGHEHTPVHKGVPEGWERKVGDELFDTAKGRSYTSNNISDTPTDHDNERPFLTLKSLNRGGGYRRDGLKHYRGPYSDDQIVGAGDVIMAVTDMTQNRAIVGQAARVPALTECEGAAISLDLVCLRPKQWSKNFLYAFCRYSGFASHLAQFANGANVLHLKPSVIGAQKLLSPAMGLVKQFDAKTIAIFNLIDILDEEAGELVKTRDLLLNRLISGKLRVDDLDIQFPPSMQDVKTA